MERAKGHLIEMWNKVNISIDERYSELMKMSELILGDIWEKNGATTTTTTTTTVKYLIVRN